MALLGLLPPYTEEDVKQAYWSKIKTLHPDHGGSPAEFHALHEAYEQAKEYVRFRGDKRAWIARHVDQYMEQERVGLLLEELGASVTRSMTEWLRGTVGDFAELTRAVTAIRLNDSAQGGQLVDLMVREHESLTRLLSLNLAGCSLSDGHVVQLCVFPSLQQLDLSRTRITRRSLQVVDMLPNLVSLQLEGTRVGWWARRRLNAELRRHATHPRFSVGRSAGFRQLQADG
jgi:hypothetical protein